VPVQFNAADGHYQVIPGASIRYPDWGRIRTRINVAESWYNGMTATLKRRFSDGLLFQASYTYSHSIDTWSGGLTGSSDYDNGAGSATDWWNPAAEKGPSNYDVPHTFILNAVYVLPFGKNLSGFKAGLAQGWQIGAIFNMASGVPFTPLIGYDYAKDLSSDADMQKPDFAPGRNGSNAILGTPDAWFDPTAFVLPPPGEYGNAGRNSLRGPNLRELDASLFKNTSVFGRNLQLRVEVFNLLNHPNFATPSIAGLFNTDGTPIPGATRITSTVTTARQIQLGVKYVF
jgi:hypothetical protein